MGTIVLGAVALVLVLFLIRAFVGADPGSLAKAIRYVGVVLLALLAIVLLAFGRLLAGLFVAALAYGLYQGHQLWPLRWLFSRVARSSAPEDRARRSGMSRAEALSVLGLPEGATEDEIRAAYLRLIQQVHPDHGGSDYFAAKLNEARDVLLGA